MIPVYPVLRQRMREQGIGSKEVAAAAEISLLAFYMRILGIKQWELPEVVRICCFFRTSDAEHLFVRKHTKP